MPSRVRRQRAQRQVNQQIRRLELSHRIDTLKGNMREAHARLDSIDHAIAAVGDVVRAALREQIGLADSDRRSLRQIITDISSGVAIEAVSADRARVGKDLIDLIDKRFEDVRQLLAQVPVEVLSNEELRIRAAEAQHDKLYADRFANGKIRHPLVTGSVGAHLAEAGLMPPASPEPVTLRDASRPWAPGDPPPLPLPGMPVPSGAAGIRGFDGILEAIRAEVEVGRNLHGGMFHSLHEAYAVLAEELDELWESVRQKRHQRHATEIRRELEQIAAVAIKSIISIQNFI